MLNQLSHLVVAVFHEPRIPTYSQEGLTPTRGKVPPVCPDCQGEGKEERVLSIQLLEGFIEQTKAPGLLLLCYRGPYGETLLLRCWHLIVVDLLPILPDSLLKHPVSHRSDLLSFEYLSW